MKRRRRILVSATVATPLIAFLAFALWPAEKEPEYQGKTLSWWLAQPKSGTTSDAIENMGTNALPLLFNWISYEPPAWRVTLIRTSRRISPRAANWLYAKTSGKFQQQQHALWAFAVLGPRAVPIIPDLMRLVTNSNPRVAPTALFVLSDFGDATVPIVLDVLTNGAKYPLIDPRVVGGLMGGPITNKAPIVPVLVACLKSENRQRVANALLMLGSLKAEPSVSVPALMRVLEDEDVNLRYQTLAALERFGPDARAAVPVLLRLHQSNDHRTRSMTEVALGEIASEVFTNGMLQAKE